MINKEIIDILNEFEAKSNLNEFVYKEMQCWPIIRSKIFYGYFHNLKRVSKKNVSKWNYFKDVLYSIKYNIIPSLIGYYFFSKNQKLVKKSNTIFLSHGSGKNQPDIADSFKYFYCYSNSTIIANNLKQNISDINISFIENLSLILANLYKLLNYNKFNSEELKFFESIFSLAKKYNFKLPFNELDIKVHLVKLFIQSKLVEYLLIKKAQLKIALLNNYDRDLAYALTLACFKNSVPTLEVQHGVISSQHHVYSRWTNVPINGYNTIPKYFACWGDYFCGIVDIWAKNTNFHSTIQIPNLSFIYWDLFVNKHSEIKEQYFLVSLQPIHNYLPDFLIETINNSTFNYKWLIRIHPGMDFDKTCDFIKSKLIHDNFIIQDPVSETIFDTLKLAILHFTAFSSIAFEALQFQVKTIFFGKNAYYSFKELIDSGVFYYSQDSRSLLKLTKENLNNTELKENRFFNLDPKLLNSSIIKIIERDDGKLKQLSIQ